jgi:hypothetical protein
MATLSKQIKSPLKNWRHYPYLIVGVVLTVIAHELIRFLIDLAWVWIKERLLH